MQEYGEAVEDARWQNMMEETLLARQCASREVHDLDPRRFRNFLDQAVATGVPHGALPDIILEVAGSNWVGNIITQDPRGDWERTATPEQARAVLEAARREGLDAFVQATLAHAMGLSPREAGLPEHHTPGPLAREVMVQACLAGIPGEAVDYIMDILNSEDETPAGTEVTGTSPDD